MVAMRGVLLAGGCWGLIFGLAALGVGGGTSAADPGYLFLCGLLVLAPALAALPAGRVLRAPLWTLEAIVSWAALGYLVLWVDPRVLPRPLALALFLTALFGALASPTLLWAARCNGRVQRARWQGYLIAGVPCGLLLLHALDAFVPLNVALFGLIAASGQGLLLIGRGRESAHRPPSEEPGAPAPPASTRPVAMLPAPATLARPARRGAG